MKLTPALPSANAAEFQNPSDSGVQRRQGWPSTGNFFSNGVPLHSVMQQVWLSTKGYQFLWPNPHEAEAPLSFYNWLRARVTIPAVKIEAQNPEHQTPVLINNLALEVYRRRPDCQQQFPDLFGLDQMAFAHWFITWARAEKLSPKFFEEVEQTRDGYRRHPLRRIYWILHRNFSRWIYSLYRQEKNLYGIYLRLNHWLEKLGLSQFFERLGAGLIAEHNVMPISIDRQTLKDINRQSEFGVNVIGFLYDESGLGRVTRDIIRVFEQNSFPNAQLDLGGVPGRLTDYSDLKPQADNPHAINLTYFGGINQYIFRLLGAEKLQNRYNIAYFWWELERLPPQLMSNLGLFNEVWVGSHFLEEVFEPIFSVPLYKMPLIIPQPVPAKMTRQDLGLPEDKHIFLFVFDPYSNIERKNPFGFITAYHQAFGPNFDDTLLVIKTKNLEQFPTAAKSLQAAVKSVQGILINRSVSRAETDALFAASDTYVSLHRVEGFGATLAEAMLHHKPVIATGYSGNMDFMTADNSYPVPYRLVPVDETINPYSYGARWAEPDLPAAAAMMKQVLKHPAETKHKVDRAAQLIQKKYSPAAFSQAAIDRLKTIHLHLQ